MKGKQVLWLLLAVAVAASIYAVSVIWSGFSALDKPSALETVVARSVRDLGIPLRARAEKNPLLGTGQNLAQGREDFLDRCAVCHDKDGSGRSAVGSGLYPKPPDLRQAATQRLSDGELHYIIRNGVRLTGMPAWGNPHGEQEDDSWKLVLFIRDLRQPTSAEVAQAERTAATAHYAGSQACEKCHAEIYARWQKTPMANVVRDPRTHPDAIIPNLETNPFKKFGVKDIAFVYGSIWKQRYFTRAGDDYFPLGAQWDVAHKKWMPYMVPKGGDWWEPFYPPDNMQRPTGPTCDGCHSVDYNIHTKQVAEWNVGCERCHGPGSEHVAHPTADNILNPAHMNYIDANDTCIQCHSQGRPLTVPIEGKYYDWPVGYRVGLHLSDYWKLEEHTLGQTSFTHFPDGTAHKNRMQGNDFVQSVMYRRGVTCFSCHDVHGTGNYAQLRVPADKLCLECHAPMSANGPRAATLEEHTHHKAGSAGSQCIACHMPKIQAEIPGVFVRSHTFRFIPPALTDQYKIPNSCNTCHTDKTTAWAGEAMEKWPEYSPWRMGWAGSPAGAAAKSN